MTKCSLLTLALFLTFFS